MKYTLFFSVLLLLTGVSVLGQENINLKNGFGAEGYDLVSYFQNKAEKGDKQFTVTHEGVNYKFHSAENAQTFQQNPEAYLPQYGGFCAYAIANSGKRVGVNPKTFTITNGKLYLFYNSWSVNTLEKWNEAGAETLQKKADSNWSTLLNSQ
jgi:YHS domain-containing protein